MEETLLVIDTGSSSMRSVLFDKYGRILEKYQTVYQMKIDGIKSSISCVALIPSIFIW